MRFPAFAMAVVFCGATRAAIGVEAPTPPRPVPPPVAAPAPAPAAASEQQGGRQLDEGGFPTWSRFDERSAKATLDAIRGELTSHADAVKAAAKPKRGKKATLPAATEPLFEFVPEYTHGEFANLPGDAFSGAVVGPDGRIYFIPLNSATVLVYDPRTDRTQTINLPNGHLTRKYHGGVLGPNGCIYCVPAHSPAVAVIDTATQEVRLLETRRGDWKWIGAAVADEGRIYAAPNLAGCILGIDSGSKDALREITGTPPFARGGFAGAALGGDGLVYFAPGESRQCLRLSPGLQDKLELFGNAPGGAAYSGVAVGPDGRLYCIPHSADHVLVIDPTVPSAIPLQLPGNQPIVGRRKFAGGVLAPDGNIYCVPFEESRILVIDTPKSQGEKASVRYWADDLGKPFKQERYVKLAYHGGVLGPDGRIYFAPFNAKHLLAIGRKRPMSMNRVLSPMFNKF